MTDLPLDASDGQILYAADYNKILGTRTEDIRPIDDTTRNYSDDTEDLGSASYKYARGYINSIYGDNFSIIPGSSYFSLQDATAIQWNSTGVAGGTPSFYIKALPTYLTIGAGSAGSGISCAIDPSSNFWFYQGMYGTLTNPEETISGGTISPDTSFITVDTEGGGGTDNLDNISWTGTGFPRLIIKANNDARTIVVRDGNTSGGNIRTNSGSSVSLDNIYKTMELIYDGSNWLEIGGN